MKFEMGSGFLGTWNPQEFWIPRNWTIMGSSFLGNGTWGSGNPDTPSSEFQEREPTAGSEFLETRNLLWVSVPGNPEPVADPPVGDSTTAVPSRNYFSIFPQQKRIKNGVVLSRIGFENRFLTIITAPSDKPPLPHWFSRSATVRNAYQLSSKNQQKGLWAFRCV
jgi:hypothetical protein